MFVQILTKIAIDCIVVTAASIYNNASIVEPLHPVFVKKGPNRTFVKENNNEKSLPESKPGDRCITCTEEMTKDNMQRMICGHALHISCYANNLACRRNCPYCNKVVFIWSICSQIMQLDTMHYLKCEHALHKEYLDNSLPNKCNNCPVCIKKLWLK